jgi:hypothetical protein
MLRRWEARAGLLISLPPNLRRLAGGTHLSRTSSASIRRGEAQKWCSRVFGRSAKPSSCRDASMASLSRCRAPFQPAASISSTAESISG